MLIQHTQAYLPQLSHQAYLLVRCFEAYCYNYKWDVTGLLLMKEDKGGDLV